VLTNSAEFGVVDHRDFFDNDIATQGKLEGYFVVELGSYVYTPSTASLKTQSRKEFKKGMKHLSESQSSSFLCVLASLRESRPLRSRRKAAKNSRKA